MAFETLVRPFTPPYSLGTQRIPVIVTQVPDADAVLTWGAAGDIVQPQEVTPSDTSGSGGGAGASGGSSFQGFGFQIQSCDTKSQEQSRQTTTQRVHNPNDSSQYVDVQIPQAITFQLKKQPNTLPGLFGGSTETFADNDEIYSLIEDIVDPPDQQDTCKQGFTFAS